MAEKSDLTGYELQDDDEDFEEEIVEEEEEVSLKEDLKDSALIEYIKEKFGEELVEIFYKYPVINDLMCSHVFVHNAGGNVVFCKEKKEWFVWNGTVWKVDVKNRHEVYAESVGRTIREVAKAGRKLGLFKQGFVVQNSSKIAAMLKRGRVRQGIAISRETFDKDDGLIFNVKNGMILLEKNGPGKPGMHSPDRKKYLTKLAPVIGIQKAKCPKWDSFLDIVMDGNKDDIEFLQKMVGSCMEGTPGRRRKLFILCGPTRTGKTTFVSVINELFGDYCKTIRPDTLMVKKYDNAIPCDVADTAGRRLLLSSETTRMKKLDIAQIKAMVGGETVTARFMRENEFTFAPQYQIFLQTNEKPKIETQDDAVWEERVLTIPFIVRIDSKTKEQRKPPFHITVIEEELSGILNWAVNGYKLFIKEGIVPTENIKNATDEYRKEQDIFSEFLKEECIVTKEYTNNKGALVKPPPGITSQVLWKRYKEYSGTHVSQKDFTTTMKDMGYEVDGRSGRKRWLGVELEERIKDIEDM